MSVYLGYSVGKSDADTLVVETIGFNGKTRFGGRACRRGRYRLSFFSTPLAHAIRYDNSLPQLLVLQLRNSP
jgi:hypothetical protein